MTTSGGTAPPLSVAALGTSLTARGAWLECLPDRLAPLLGRPVTTRNFARVGANSRVGLSLIDEVARALPQVVLLEFAVNDAAVHRGVSLAESAVNVTTMVRALRHAIPDAHLYLMTMNPVHGWRGLLRPRLPAYYDQYAPIASRERVGCIDNRPAWAALSRAALRAAVPDGAHPIARAAQAIVTGNVVAALVRDLVGLALPAGQAQTPAGATGSASSSSNNWR